MSRLGRDFEEAVYAFVKTLDPSAEVLFDCKVQDRDTGNLRQCDVWINTKIGDQWPISILVSCKDRAKSRRKVDVTDIESFSAEVISTGANTGIIYSNVGFTKQAIRKAKAKCISCCRLYRDEPADLPETLWLSHFVCATRVRLNLFPCVAMPKLETWNDVFDIPAGDGDKTILDMLCEDFANQEEAAIANWKTPESRSKGLFPQGWSSAWQLTLDDAEQKLILSMSVEWRKYTARSKAILLDGSYCVSDGTFKGRQTGPAVDLKSAHPGKDWEEIGEDYVLPPSRIVMALASPDLRGTLREGLGHQPCFPFDQTQGHPVGNASHP